MLKIAKGQYSLEFLVTYGWALLVILVTVGALFYFDVFSIDKYLPEECLFGPNVQCQDWSITKISDQRFDLDLKLKNNLERRIEPVNITLMEEDGTLLDCRTREVYCPFNSTSQNWSAADYDTELSEITDSHWNVGMACRFQMGDCERTVSKNTKEDLKLLFGFKREGGTNVYELNARIRTRPS